MNIYLTLSVFTIAIVVLLGFFFTLRRGHASQKPRTKRHTTRRFQRQPITGIQPLVLRASLPRRAARPPIVHVSPQAIAPSPPSDESRMTSSQKAALQTTVYALPVSHPLVLPSCPRCNKQSAAHDLFCGACGMRLHRSSQHQSRER